MVQVARRVTGRLWLALGLIIIAHAETTAQAPEIKSVPFVESLCVEQPPKVVDRRQGTGTVATPQSKVTFRLSTFAVAPDGVSAAPDPVKTQEVDYDFPFIRSIGVRMLGTTNQFLADAIIPRQGEPMRVGGQRRVAIPCRHQLFDVDVLAVTEGGAPPFHRSERSNDRSLCWTNKDAKEGSIKGRSGAKPTDYTYRQLRDRLITLVEKNPGWAQAIDYGTSLKGCPLTLLRIARDVIGTSSGIRPAVAITGAIHGNEYLGIEMKLAEHFLEQREQMAGLTAYLASGGVIYFVPVANPDGFDADARINAASEIAGRNDRYVRDLDLDPDPPGSLGDLNRDFAIRPLDKRRFTNPESSGLASYIDDDLRLSRLHLDFSLDYHCCAVGLITPWTYNDSDPNYEDRADFELIKLWGVSYFTGRSKDFEVGTFREVTHERVDAPGSSIDYYYAMYGTRAIAIEGERKVGTMKGEVPQVQQHLDFLDRMFMYLAARYRGPQP